MSYFPLGSGSKSPVPQGRSSSLCCGRSTLTHERLVAGVATKGLSVRVSPDSGSTNGALRLRGWRFRAESQVGTATSTTRATQRRSTDFNEVKRDSETELWENPTPGKPLWRTTVLLGNAGLWRGRPGRPLSGQTLQTSCHGLSVRYGD